jgi:hypothetical protein
MIFWDKNGIVHCSVLMGEGKKSLYYKKISDEIFEVKNQNREAEGVPNSECFGD